MKKVVENGKIVEYYTEKEVVMIAEYLTEITRETFEKIGIKLDNKKIGENHENEV